MFKLHGATHQRNMTLTQINQNAILVQMVFAVRVGIWPITPEFVLKLGWAVGKVLARQGNGKVLIGKDTRISGYMFESVLESGLSAAGIDTHLLGPMPTPAIAYLNTNFACASWHCD